MSKTSNSKKPDQVKTTGHAWDGIEEYNNPLPLWWLRLWMVCIVCAVGYAVYYPVLPGVPSISEEYARSDLTKTMEAAKAAKAPFDNRIAATDVDAINADPELRRYAIESGRALFAVSCVQCHGAGGAGAKGYPNLLDDEWLYGGTLQDIVTTVTHGIRSRDDAQTRDVGVMMAFGRDELLDAQQINDVINYVKTIAYGYKGNESSVRGATVFAENCTSCHGDHGQGMREMGAPPLNNPIWLYGGDTDTLKETLHNGRAGVMPSFSKLGLSATDIKKLAVYVHSLGGGE